MTQPLADLRPAELRAPRTATHLPFLTGMRGLAAAFVALRHLEPGYAVTETLEVLSVYAFFVLSAYLLTLRSLETLPTGTAGQVGFWSRYGVRRLFRVYPLYLLGTLVIFAATLAVPAVADLLARDHGGFSLLGQVSMVKPLRTLFWTIPLEMEYYLVIPFIVLAASRHPWGTVAACAGVAVLWSLLRDPAATLYHPHLLSGALGPIFLAASASGIAVHQIRTRADPARPDPFRPPRWLAKLLSGLAGRNATYVTLVLLLALLAPEIRDLLPGTGSGNGGSYRTLPVLLPGTLLCAVVVAGTLSTRTGDPLIRFFSLPVLQRAGEISYSVYLTHPVAIGVLRGIEAWSGQLPWLAELPLFAAMVYALASLTFATVERPMIAWGERLVRPRAGGHLA